MEDIMCDKRGAGGKLPYQPVRSYAGFRLRATGLLYLALSGIFIRIAFLIAVFPGIFNAAEPHYQPINACEMLECAHGYERGPGGELYCAKYPPKEILDTRISPSLKKARLITAAIFGIVGLVFAITTLISGFLWLLGLWIPRKPARWYTVLCRAAPLMVILFWIAACMSKAVYPIPPR